MPIRAIKSATSFVSVFDSIACSVRSVLIADDAHSSQLKYQILLASFGMLLIEQIKHES